jgi:hypothetical protein
MHFGIISLTQWFFSIDIFGKIIPKIANSGSKTAGISLDIWENCINFIELEFQLRKGLLLASVI